LGVVPAETVSFGDVQVRRLGFGAMRITGRGIWGDPPDRGRAIRVLRDAVDAGVQIIDTADSYGPETSEQLIAEALHPYPDDLLIATKAGFDRPGPWAWTPNGRPEHLRQAVEGSLSRLRCDRLGLVQLHTVDPAVPLAESLGALVELQRDGKIEQLGVSNVDVDELTEARSIADIVSVQNKFGLTDRSGEAVLEVCEQLSLPFLPWYPLGGDGKLPRAVKQVAKRHRATPAQVAIAWLLARSPQLVPIPGTGDPKHLAENMAASDLALEHADLQALDAL
jgi:aryl-alcohol dehydrogenase-like predicted oxidoreductase